MCLSAVRFDVMKAERAYILHAYYKENRNYETIRSSFRERFPNVIPLDFALRGTCLKERVYARNRDTTWNKRSRSRSLNPER